jgi:hypothetical protein
MRIAIKSMFRWYKHAAVCYAWLVDMPNQIEHLIELEQQQQAHDPGGAPACRPRHATGDGQLARLCLSKKYIGINACDNANFFMSSALDPNRFHCES